MGCPGCGKPGAETFCSNACFVRNSGPRDCELCNPRGMGSRRICTRCAADPANADWVDGRELLLGADAEEGQELLELAGAEQRHADVMDRRLRQVTPRQRRILELALKGEVVRRQRWLRRGRRRVRCGTYEVHLPLSLRAIGRAADCSHQYVAKVIRRQLEG